MWDMIRKERGNYFTLKFCVAQTARLRELRGNSNCSSCSLNIQHIQGNLDFYTQAFVTSQMNDPANIQKKEQINIHQRASNVRACFYFNYLIINELFMSSFIKSIFASRLAAD